MATRPTSYQPLYSEYFAPNSVIREANQSVLAGDSIEEIAENTNWLLHKTNNCAQLSFLTPLSNASAGFTTVGQFSVKRTLGSKQFKCLIRYSKTSVGSYQFKVLSGDSGGANVTITDASATLDTEIESTLTSSSADYSDFTTDEAYDIQISTDGVGTGYIHAISFYDDEGDTTLPTGDASLTGSDSDEEAWHTIDTSIHLQDPMPMSAFAVRTVARNLAYIQKDVRLQVCAQYFNPPLKARRPNNRLIVLTDGDNPTDPRTVAVIPVIPRRNTGWVYFKIVTEDSSYSGGNVSSVYITSDATDSTTEITITSTSTAQTITTGKLPIKQNEISEIKLACGREGADLSTLGGGRGRFEIQQIAIWEDSE